MKWPFVRKSKYEYLNQNYLEAKSMFESYAQMNRDNLIEINRLNQELASELNSHRETKKELEETKDALKIAIDDLKNAALCIGEQKTQLEIWKKRSNFYSNNCTEAKESISKVRGHLKTIAKNL